jgi:hypothetical protein
LKKIVTPMLLCTFAILFAGCAKKGPMETAGAKVDEAARTIQNGGEKTTGDKVEDATNDVKKDVEKAADDVKK